MDFFAAQDQARRLTVRLVLLFLAAVVAIVIGVNVIAAVLTATIGHQFGHPVIYHWHEINPEVYLWTTIATLLVIAGGTLYRIQQLAAGGEAVARMVGARRVSAHTQDLAERRLVNVVEEMAIASGTTVPGIYVLEDENSINAFAAGYSPNEAVVAVTRGCVNHLSRDELQGVIAHEFSHILNGDMRLNIRLIGILNGITVIGAIGMALLRGGSTSSRRSYRSDRRGGGGGALAILVAGAGLAAVGYAGVLAGRLIKAGVSRQREYLADASAVQFTRDTQGIAGALRKIRAHVLGSRVHNRYAEELSHMFFGPVFRLGFGGFLATHPPIDDRITRIDPSFSAGDEPALGSYVPPPPASSPVTPLSEYEPPAATCAAAADAPHAEDAMASIGQPGPEHLAYAVTVHAGIPETLLNLAHRPESAAVVLYALLLHPDPRRQQQIDLLAESEGEHMRHLLADAIPNLASLREDAYLPLLDVAIPQMKEQPQQARNRTLGNMKRIVQADGRIDLREFALYAVARRHLRSDAAKPVKVRHRNPAPIKGAIALALGCLAHAGHADSGTAENAYRAAAQAIDIKLPPLPDANDCTGLALEKALAEIAALALMPKMQVVRACAECALSDREVTTAEKELLRAICDVLDCPMPPLIGDNTESRTANSA